MAAPSKKLQQNAPTGLARIYNPIGFSKGYNFVLWVIFAGALLGFTLARLMYLDFNGRFCPAEARNNSDGSGGAAPGECYYYRNFSRYKIGILLHLAGILPAGLLAVLQFTPIIRRRWVMFHRIAGYAAIILYIVSLVGVIMIARRAFGGGLEVQAWCGFVGFGVLFCMALAWYNIRKLQIEQHRAWMLRAWFYASSIITTRIIMIISAVTTANMGYYMVWSCAKIAFIITDPVELVARYPVCAAYLDGTNPDQVSAVAADFEGGTGVNIGAALNMSFGAALWLAFNLHALGVEIYLALTPKEAERLRAVSYARQAEAGLSNPGSAGLTADRLGDADKWVVPKSENTSDAVLLTDSDNTRNNSTL